MRLDMGWMEGLSPLLRVGVAVVAVLVAIWFKWLLFHDEPPPKK
jgi:uncharacterized membrane protein YukC